MLYDTLDDDDPLVIKVLEELRDVGISNLSGPYTKHQLAHFQTCAPIARRVNGTNFCSTMGLWESTSPQVHCENFREVVVLE